MITFSGRKSFGSATIGMERVEVVRDTMSRRWLDVAEGDITLEILEMEKRVEVIGTGVMT